MLGAEPTLVRHGEAFDATNGAKDATNGARLSGELSQVHRVPSASSEYAVNDEPVSLEERRAIGRHDGGSLAGELLQPRLALFGRVMLLFCVLGYGMTNLVTLVFGRGGVDGWLSDSNLALLAASMMFLVVWLVARGTALSFRSLRLLDLVGTVAPAALLDVMALLLPMELRPDLTSRHLVMLLVTTNMVIARAVVIPSPPEWTFVVSALAAIPALICAGLLRDPGELTMRVAYAFTWSLIAVLTSTFASHVIYGLRRSVREARRLGRYTLVEKLGSGGMGVVYRAEHAMLRRPTAVKLLDPGMNEQALARFEREVQLTAELTHPNTIAIYDYGHTPEGVCYYAMELVDGLDLEALVKGHGPQDPARVVHLLRQACGSLAEAHEAGLVHRDIKPSNLVVTMRRGQGDVLKVLDFGLVKVASNDPGDPGISRAGTVLGTPLYLSPEAINAPERVGPSSDLYALGAVAYWLLTGKPVFTGTSVVELCAAHLLEAPIPLREKGCVLPAELERIVLSCLGKDPADRPASAAALSEELAACGIASWTLSDASEWWNAHHPSIPAPQSRQG